MNFNEISQEIIKKENMLNDVMNFDISLIKGDKKNQAKELHTARAQKASEINTQIFELVKERTQMFKEIFPDETETKEVEE